MAWYKHSLLLLVVSLTPWASSYGQTQDAAVVRVAPVKRLVLAPQMMVSGQVQSRLNSSLSAGVDGRLLWVAEPGQQVQAGEVIARVDPEPLDLRIKELAAQLKRATIQAQQLGREFERQQQLVSKALISKNQLEQTQADFELAKADIEVSRATLAQLQQQRAKTELTAPFAGVVAQRFHQVGEELTRGQPLLQLVNLEQLEVRVFAPLHFYGHVATGDRLQVQGARDQWQLPVTAVVPVSDGRSQTFEIRLDANDAAMYVGQLVSVGVPTDDAKAQLAIHRDALVLGASQHVVFRVHGDVAQRIRIEPGQGQGEWLQVTGDLAEGDQLVIRGADTLTDGRKVRILPTTAASASASASD